MLTFEEELKAELLGNRLRDVSEEGKLLYRVYEEYLKLKKEIKRQDLKLWRKIQKKQRSKK